MKKIILLLGVMFLILISIEMKYTGFLSKSDDVIIDSDIEIAKSDMKVCCSFRDVDGEIMRCSVLKRFDCSFCEKYC